MHFDSTIGSINTDYLLSLVGKSGTSKISFDSCADAFGGFIYAFGESSYTRTVDESAYVNTGICILSPGPGETSVTEAYSSSPESSFACGPTCTYAELNRIIVGNVDGNGQTFNLVVQHVPGTKIISSAQTYTSGWIFREVLTLD